MQAMRQGGRNQGNNTCFFCKDEGHRKWNCSKFKIWLENKSKGASGHLEGAKKAEGENVAIVTEFASQARVT